MDGRKFCCWILFYVLGLFVMAFGVTFAANSNLGMSPVNSIPSVLSAITNIEMGTIVSAVGVGTVMGPIQKVVLPPIRRICFGSSAEVAQ